MHDKIKQFKSRLTALVLGILIIILTRLLVGKYQTAEYVHQGHTMGTVFSVKVVKRGLSRRAHRQWMKDVEGILQNISRSMSHYDPGSEISLFNNDNDINNAHAISKDLAFVLKESMRIYEESKGCFDVTVGPLVDLWGFGPKQVLRLPGEDEIKSALVFIGSDKIVLNDKNELRKRTSGTQINLSAIAKGFGVDKAAQYLEAQGCLRYMVEIGGEVRCKGKNSNELVWRIGIDVPRPDLLPGESLQAVVALKDLAMATSGEYRNFIRTDQKIYSHTIDPKTGYPISHNLASVTVLAKNCLEADAYATAANVMGAEKGLAWISRIEGAEGYFIIRDKDGSFRVEMTEGFRQYVVRD